MPSILVGILTLAAIGSSVDAEAAVREEQSWKPAVDESRWEYLVLHHSATESGSVESIHAEHSRRKDSAGRPWLGIGYHFVIGNGNGMPDGQVVPTFRWREQLHGAHSGHELFNARGVGICLIGNFELKAPTQKQLQSLKQLLKVLCRRQEISLDRVIGHGSVRATACPGRLFPLRDVREAVRKSLQS